MQVFYDIGQPSSQHDSARLPLPPDESLRALRFPLPAEPIKLLRIDPADDDSTVHIGQIRLLTDDGHVLKTFGPDRLRPMWQIEKITLQKEIATVRPHPGVNDPMLLVAEPLQRDVHVWLGRSTLGPPTVLLLGLIAVVLIATAIVGACRTALANHSSPRLPAKRLALLTFAAVFLLVTGTRLSLLKDYSSPLPLWDEWEADALYLLIPLRGGFLDWQALFIPQAEHRIVLTRLITLVGTLLNGEWDPRLAMTLSAAFFGTAIALCAALIIRPTSWFSFSLVALITLAAALPFDPSNLFWGGQSQMYALTLLAICPLAIAAFHQPDTFTWLAAAAAGIASLGTMGSGIVAPALGCVLCAWRWFREPHQRRGLAGSSVIFGVVTAIGLLASAASRRHSVHYAASLTEFWRAFESYGAWPLPSGTLSLLAVWSPWILHGFLLLRRRHASPLDWFAAGLGAWALVSTAGLAFARPDLAAHLDPRHFTALFVNFLAPCISTAALWHADLRRSALISTAAVATLAIGLVRIEQRGFEATRQQLSWHEARDAIVLPFLWTGDRQLLQDLPPDGRCPYWNSALLAHYLDSPLLQPVLPFKLRKALAERPASEPPASIPGPGNLTLFARTGMKLGPAFVLVGALLLAWSRPKRATTAPADSNEAPSTPRP
jgi:hypothetical protein